MIVDALEPRPIRARLPRAEALAELDREIRSVTLWAVRAISSAWDTRRLGYGNEGHHPYEHEVAALVGKNAGFAPDYLAAARDALAEHEAALAADPQHRGASASIAELAAECELSPAAIDELLAIAAPSLHGDGARLYGILGNDPGRVIDGNRCAGSAASPRPRAASMPDDSARSPRLNSSRRLARSASWSIGRTNRKL